MIKTHHIEVPRSARYHSRGQLTNKTKRIWFALHGYGQLAESIANRIDCLDEETDYLICPEGLSRFYWEGFGGKPVASWMTSSDRLSEIDDYVRYLDLLFFSVNESLAAHGLNSSDVEIVVLGFSQGTATAARWLAQGKAKADYMLFWAGPLPDDVDWEKSLALFNNSSVYLFFGDQDQFITEKHRNSHEEKLKALGLQFESISYEGKHAINQAALSQWIKSTLH
ncbi:dienelactone hydrolase family protein [Chitinophagales bacterium]|nr:dienelactone hydrolase family protein [Chitinophagales bacterium]